PAPRRAPVITPGPRTGAGARLESPRSWSIHQRRGQIPDRCPRNPVCDPARTSRTGNTGRSTRLLSDRHRRWRPWPQKLAGAPPGAVRNENTNSPGEPGRPLGGALTSTTEPAPFFSRSGSLFLPQPHAHSPWSTDMLHGRLLGGLLARAVEIEHGDPELQFARLTVDLFRNTGMVPVRVETGVVRQGRRIKVVDATAYADDQPVARASAVMLRRGEQPNGQVPSTPPSDMPAPDALGPAPESPLPFDVWYVDESGNPAKDLRIAGKRRAWARERHNLVDDEPMSPFVRAAMAGDFASPLANYSTTGLEFINSD